MRIKLSDHFNYSRLIRYSLSAMAMMLFTSIYSIVDGFFVSNYCGKIPFTALNLIYPIVMVISTLGFMLGTGGSAVVAITLGEGDKERAKKYFSMFVYVAIGGGILFTSLGQIFLRQIAELMGAKGDVLEYCVKYARIVLISTPALILQVMFQTFFNTAEKPKLGLQITVLSGCTNMVLDFVLVGLLNMGIAGAAWATVFSEYVGGVLPLLYFGRENDSLLRIVKTSIDWGVIARASWNGVSEFMSNVGSAIISICYNLQLLKYAGEDGVSAFGVVMYVYLLFAAITIGYAIASAPIIGYHYGAQNKAELKNLFKRSLVIMMVSGVIMFAAAELLSGTIARIFVSYDEDLMILTRRAFRLTSITYLLFGFNVFASSFFTALGNGTVSAIIQVMRILVLQLVFIYTLPPIFGLSGIWYAFILTDAAAIFISGGFLIAERKRYGY